MIVFSLRKHYGHSWDCEEYGSSDIQQKAFYNLMYLLEARHQEEECDSFNEGFTYSWTSEQLVQGWISLVNATLFMKVCYCVRFKIYKQFLLCSWLLTCGSRCKFSACFSSCYVCLLPCNPTIMVTDSYPPGMISPNKTFFIISCICSGVLSQKQKCNQGTCIKFQ